MQRRTGRLKDISSKETFSSQFEAVPCSHINYSKKRINRTLCLKTNCALKYKRTAADFTICRSSKFCTGDNALLKAVP